MSRQLTGGTALAGTGQTSRFTAFTWLNPKNGVSYGLSWPSRRNTAWISLDALQNVPITGATAGVTPQVLAGIADIHRDQAAAIVTHYNILPTIDIYATTQDRDLGGVAGDVQKIVDANVKYLPRGSTVILRGQVVTMQTAFTGLFRGLVVAILLIYLLIVVNFQSWTDPFVIVTALPARRWPASSGCCSSPAPPCRCRP